jgi:curved DNA-binding protein
MTTTYRDYYQILGVPRNADEQEIKRAYRKLARRWHPDANPGDAAAAARFRAAAEAYEVLSDAERRRRYDRRRPDRAAGAGWGHGAPAGRRDASRPASPDDLREVFGAATPFPDFFRTVFGEAAFAAAGAPARERAAGPDAEAALEVTLEEALRGGTRALQVEETGGRAPAGRRRVEVRIPPGVAHGTRLRLAGQGAAGAGDAPPGDLYLRVVVRPHPRFERCGADLYTTVPVPVATLVRGGDVSVPAPDGGALRVTVPPETPDGRTLRLRGQGLPRPRRPYERGDLYVRCEALLPVGTTEAERRRLQRSGVLRRREARPA